MVASCSSANLVVRLIQSVQGSSCGSSVDDSDVDELSLVVVVSVLWVVVVVSQCSGFLRLLAS